MLKDLRKNTPKNAEERAQFELQKIAAVQVRAAKREGKGDRIRADEKYSKETRGIGDAKNKQKGNKKLKKTANSFESELTQTSKSAVKKFRYGPSFQEKKELGLVEKGQKRKEKLKQMGKLGGGGGGGGGKPGKVGKPGGAKPKGGFGGGGGGGKGGFGGGKKGGFGGGKGKGKK